MVYFHGTALLLSHNLFSHPPLPKSVQSSSRLPYFVQPIPALNPLNPQYLYILSYVLIWHANCLLISSVAYFNFWDASSFLLYIGSIDNAQVHTTYAYSQHPVCWVYSTRTFNAQIRTNTRRENAANHRRIEGYTHFQGSREIKNHDPASEFKWK